MNRIERALAGTTSLVVLLSTVAAAQRLEAPPSERDVVALPRWRLGGTPPEDPAQSLVPYVLTPSGAEIPTPPTSGLLQSPPEYAPSDGVVFRYNSGSWASVVTDCVAALTGDPAHDEIAYVVVAGPSQRASAENQFAGAGADLAKVQFIVAPTNSIWLRDYGPHFTWQAGTKVIVDSHYYPSRPLDNFIPTRLADDHLVVPSYDMGLYYSGGNFQPGPNRSGFITSLIFQDNFNFSAEYVAELYGAYQGIDRLHVFPRLPGTVDSTGHIDMWLYLVDEDTAIISKFLPGSNQTAIDITENAVPYMESLGFEVFRVPAWNAGNTHFTYTNAYRVNDRIFVPVYGSGNSNYLDDDAVSLGQWQRAAGPTVEIVPIDCYSIIPAAGAIHCIVMQVPRYTDSVPVANVLQPDGGDLLATDTLREILWAATDDEDVASIGLSYSTDGGLTFPNRIASGLPNDGVYEWRVPLVFSPDAILGVFAEDGDGNVVSDVSALPFSIVQAATRTYDFTTGAGVDKWGWGHRTASWAQVAGQRRPLGVSTEVSAIQSDAYAALAASDTEGGDGAPGRYISPTPGSNFESTHTFEFELDEDPARILDIGVTWEGYGDQCLQVELYVWDYVQGDWADGAGQFGENRYMACYAGNRDEAKQGHIRTEFFRYVVGNRPLTLLLYAERPGQKSFHDYVAVTVTSR